MTPKNNRNSFPEQVTPSSGLNSSPQASRPKILVVDAHPVSRQLMVESLLYDGYDVITLDNSLGVPNLITHQDFDLLILDIPLVDQNGFELCRSLKQNPQVSHIPVLFVTITEDRRSRIQALEAGGADLLTKPLDRVELSLRVKSLIQHKHLLQDLHQSKRVLFSIAQTIEQRYSPQPNPSEHLVQLAQDFGEFLELSPLDICHLRYAAYLHDIGAIAIPDAIFLKPTPLTPEERHLLHQHVLLGEQICQPLHDLQGVLPIIRHHHERWDGSGYPDGLTGEQIPWLVQVFQIVDIFDALISPRPHKQPLSPYQALAILIEEAKQGWRNPRLVEQFCLFLNGATSPVVRARGSRPL